MKAKAVRFVRDVLGDEGRADEIENEDPTDYAERKGVRMIENPRKKGTLPMPRRLTRQELESKIEELEIENEALTEKLDSIAELATADEEDDRDGS